ncbi:MAG: hypothetical protein A2Y93_00595 [Chloroflexi bacterium RBG_13_68_17]|nr:MAG: hypothetical protein A2Y93_00595 [Chloroflexi bacterium RBG_13_68_17]
MIQLLHLERPTRLVTLVATLLFGIVLIRTAWVTDDAYITLRTVDNFVSGRGLTWNPDERVQAYTHPLWMFILTGAYALTHEGFLTTIAVSMAVSMAAFWLISTRLTSDPWSVVIGVTILLLSKSFIDFSTSGMENPATHLLLAVFLIWYLSGASETPRRRSLLLGLVTSAATLIRPDLFLIVLPAVAYGFVRSDGGPRGRAMLLAGLLPLVAWEAFSVIYYGSLVPNTAYAKLNTGIPFKDLLEQGALYYLNGIDLDPLSMTVIAAGLAAAGLWGNGAQRRIALGTALYLGYVLIIGGDFMSGRMFSPAVLVSTVLLVKLVASESVVTKLFLLGTVILLGFSSLTPTLLSGSAYAQPIPTRNGIGDKRSDSFTENGLLPILRNAPRPSHHWVLEGLELSYQGRVVLAQDAIGYLGYFAGPDVHIVDEVALADPLLARLPASDPLNWRIALFYRDIPTGYLESIETGVNRIADPDLARLYDKIHLITSGELFDPERLRAIWELNTGQYAQWIRNYVERTADVSRDSDDS